MKLKEYLEKNKYAKALVLFEDDRVIVEFAIVDDKNKKSFVVAHLENEHLTIQDKTLGGLSEYLITTALMALDKEVHPKDLEHMIKLTEQIERDEVDAKA